MIVQRKVSNHGATQVAGQKLQISIAHRNTVVDIQVEDTMFQIYDSAGELLASIPKTTTKGISRYKATVGAKTSDRNRHPCPGVNP